MKRVVCLFGLLWFGLAAKSQMYMNGLTINGNGQYLELYNAGLTTTGVSLNCYTVVTYFKEKASEGFYVLSLPQFLVAPQRAVFLAGADNIAFPDGASYSADINWNQKGSGVTLKKYVFEKNGSRAAF